MKSPGELLHMRFGQFRVETVVHGPELLAELRYFFCRAALAFEGIGEQWGKGFEILLLHAEAGHFRNTHADPGTGRETLIGRDGLVVGHDVTLLELLRRDTCFRVPGVNYYLVSFGEVDLRVAFDQNTFAMQGFRKSLGVHYDLFLVLVFERVHFDRRHEKTKESAKVMIAYHSRERTSPDCLPQIVPWRVFLERTADDTSLGAEESLVSRTREYVDTFLERFLESLNAGTWSG